MFDCQRVIIIFTTWCHFLDTFATLSCLVKAPLPSRSSCRKNCFLQTVIEPSAFATQNQPKLHRGSKVEGHNDIHKWITCAFQKQNDVSGPWSFFEAMLRHEWEDETPQLTNIN
jgi:hypothetical protein